MNWGFNRPPPFPTIPTLTTLVAIPFPRLLAYILLVDNCIVYTVEKVIVSRPEGQM